MLIGAFPVNTHYCHTKEEAYASLVCLIILIIVYACSIIDKRGRDRYYKNDK